MVSHLHSHLHCAILPFSHGFYIFKLLKWYKIDLQYSDGMFYTCLCVYFCTANSCSRGELHKEKELKAQTHMFLYWTDTPEQGFLNLWVITYLLGQGLVLGPPAVVTPWFKTGSLWMQLETSPGFHRPQKQPESQFRFTSEFVKVTCFRRPDAEGGGSWLSPPQNRWIAAEESLRTPA